MAAQALYRKWRPRTFDQVVGQEHVVRTLRNALASESIRHAYLFAGPRGTGKTSLARLLAKAVNCLGPEGARPCDECAICQAVNEARLLDLIEIDAASNTGVDDVRELRERVGFRPNEARYKVYVIDEAHMLSNAAFNALLKTLEEPPPHAIFVLATTEPQKVPATVRSRCQRFDFRRIRLGDIVRRLEWLAEREKIKAEPDALLLIARQATGSLRDAEGLLDQLASYGSEGITAADVRAALGASTTATVIDVADALAGRDLASGLAAIANAVDEGGDPRQLARQLVEHLRALLLLRLGSGLPPDHVAEDQRERVEAQAAAFSPSDLSKAIQLFSRAAGEARGGWQPQLPVEMAFVEAALPPQTERTSPSSRPADTPRPEAVRETGPKLSATWSSEASAKAEEEAAEAPAPAETAAAEDGADQGDSAPEAPADGSLNIDAVRNTWSRLLGALRSDNRSLEALMRSCSPKAVEGDVVVLGFAHSFHRDKVEESQNKLVVEDALSEVLGSRYRIRCILDASAGSDRGSDSERAEGGEAVEQDPVVRAAVEDLGAQVVGAAE
jgi:DNA polymerase-3 subunit gamma/tau